MKKKKWSSISIFLNLVLFKSLTDGRKSYILGIQLFLEIQKIKMQKINAKCT